MTSKNALCGSCLMVLLAYGLQLNATSIKREPASTVFRIGTFDRSSFEFASGNPEQAVNFVVGQSDPAKDWYATQPAALAPASAAIKTDVATAPRAIHFTLERTPSATYRLRISLVIESASVPALRIGINGKHALC